MCRQPHERMKVDPLVAEQEGDLGGISDLSDRGETSRQVPEGVFRPVLPIVSPIPGTR